MKRTKHLSIPLAGLLLAGLAASAYEPQIKLAPGGDRVLPIEQRATVLEVAELLMARDEAEAGVEVADLDSPFEFGVSATIVAEAAEPEATRQIRYSDEALVERVHQHFTLLVKGYMMRSGRAYLQLKGGKLIESGSSFPIRLPSLPDNQPILVTIENVTQRSYVLRINQATRVATMPGYEAVGGDSVHLAKQDREIPAE